MFHLDDEQLEGYRDVTALMDDVVINRTSVGVGQREELRFCRQMERRGPGEDGDEY